MTVCDPACGSGNFLVAAARRLASGRVRNCPDQNQSNDDSLHELREVIANSIFGVDADPAAVELCKLALWLEYADPTMRLDFLDHRIKCGNSILGATPDSIAAGIPDEAFEPAGLDEPSVCVELRQQNRAERRSSQCQQLGANSSPSRNDSFAADAWCAAFAAEKTAATRNCAITDGVLCRIQSGPHEVAEEVKLAIGLAQEQHRFFHWSLEFPAVFERNGGFDVVVGNPPFVNGIEGRMSAKLRSFARFMHPRVKGAADLGYFFLDQALKICRAGGYVGFVQPRALLNARPLEWLRRPSDTGFHPRMLFASSRPNLFRERASL